MLILKRIQYQNYPKRILKLPSQKCYNEQLQISWNKLKNKKKNYSKEIKSILKSKNYRNEKYSNRNKINQMGLEQW